MQWFRFYSETLNDPKVIALRPSTRWYWVALLSVTSQQKERGTLPDSIATIAMMLRIKPSRVQPLLDTLINANLLEMDSSGTLRIHNWEGRQMESDDVTDRVRSFRDRSKKSHVKRFSNVSVTPSETETETEEENTPPPIAREGGVPIRKREEERIDPPAEIQRVADRAERLFPACHHDSFVHQLAAEYPIAWIDVALTRASDSQKSSRSYLRGILQGIQADGGLRAPVKIRAAPSPSPVVPSESKADRIRRIHKALGLEGEPLITDEEIRTHDEEVRRGGLLVREMAGGTQAPASRDVFTGDRQRERERDLRHLAESFQAARDS